MTLTAILVIGTGAGAVYYASRPDEGPRGAGASQARTQGSGAGGGRGRFRGGDEGPVPVLVAAAEVADVPIYLEAVGTARALKTVTVRPQVEGKLVEIAFREGQDVRRGDVLARIDPTIYRALYDQAVAKKAQDEAQLVNARLNLDRAVRLLATSSGTSAQVDTQRAAAVQLEAQVKADQAAIDNAKAVLDYTDITAPIDGRTGIRQVDEGNIVRAGESTGIVVITQIRPVSVLFNLPQQDLPKVNAALARGEVSADAVEPDGKTLIDRGKLLVVDNQVDPTTGTVRLKAEFPNAELRLWPGQFVNVRLLVDTLRGVTVAPTAAVQRGPNGTFVYVLQGEDAVSVRPVTVALQDDQQAVVAGGLGAGERVVTTGFARLTEGARVRIAAAEEAPPASPPQAGAPPVNPSAGGGEVARPGRRGPPDGQGRGEGRRRREGGANRSPGAQSNAVAPGSGGPP